MWIWLENSPVGVWVGESLWGYPFVLSLHAVGLAVVVGVFLLRDARLLGLFPDLDLRAFLQIGKLGWAGFVVNAISGGFLFTAQADTFVHSTPFLLKISFIAAAMILAAVIQGRMRDIIADGGSVATGSLRLVVLASMLLWTGAIIAGRLIAYL